MQLKKFDKGARVRDVQKMLEYLGFKLPRYGADGDLGEETLEAMGRFLHEHALEKDEDARTIDDEEIEILTRIYEARRRVAIPIKPELYRDSRNRSSRKHDGGPRPWTQVTGMCAHQTACNLGEKAERMLTVGAHAVITRAGVFHHLHDFNRVIWHGNGWNDGTSGFEFDGLLAGVDGNPKTVWNDPDTPWVDVAVRLTPEQVDTGLKMIEWHADYVEAHGGKIRALVAHRQSSASRRNDPGSQFWKEVALPLMKKRGWSDGGAGFKIGNGYPIPEEWDPSRKGYKY